MTMSLLTRCVGLSAWCINIVTYYRVFCDVEPKRKALAIANQELAAARDKLSKIKAKIKVYRQSEDLLTITMIKSYWNYVLRAICL